MKISIIIPVLNEKKIINKTLENLYRLKNDYDIETIVVEATPDLETVDSVYYNNVIKLSAEKGRAKQMNQGAKLATGDVLVFLHADTVLPENAFKKIQESIKNNFVAGAFSLKIDSPNILLKVISFTANMRVYFTKIPYGDQAIFIKKSFFEKIGGYRDIPFMEDVDIMKRIKKSKERICILKEKVKTSPRRWNEQGIFYTTFKNNLIRILYSFGVSLNKLKKIYYSKKFSIFL